MATPNVQTDAMGNFGMAPGAAAAPVAPVEPQAVTDARANPLYIGSTNFGNLQKKYTPYQIEQATTRDASGNIFWKQGADISKISASPPPFAAPTVAPTPSTANLQTTTSAPVETITTPTPVSAQDQFAAGQSEAAKNYLTGIQSTLDGLLAKQQAMETAAKAAAQAKVDATKGKISAMADSTAAQDALKASREMFQVTQTITALNEVRTRIADATAALDQGIIYEENQPVRMNLLTGRSAALKKQGLAHLGALQATSEILKGNIELAQAYATDSIAAIKQDNDQRREALTTLLNMDNDNLVSLTKEEKDTIDSRMKLLENESARLDKQKDDVMDLATKYPLAFTQGSVLLTDTPEQAISKMARFMSEEQKLELEQKRLDLAKTKADIAKTNRTSTGGGSGGAAATGLTLFSSDDQAIINAGFAAGKTLETIINDLGGPSAFSKKQLDSLQDFWSSKGKPVTTKPASTSEIVDLGLNPAERPELIGKTLEEIAKIKIEEKAAEAKKAEELKKLGWWGRFKNKIGVGN